MHLASSVVALTVLVAAADAAKKGGERRRRALEASSMSMSLSMSIMPLLSMDFVIDGIQVPTFISKGTESVETTIQASSKKSEKGTKDDTKKTDKKQTKASKEPKARKISRRALQDVTSSLSMIFIIEGVEVPTYAVEKVPDIEGATFEFDVGELMTSTPTATVSPGTEKMESATVATDTMKTMDKTNTKTAKAAKEPKARKLYSVGRRARVDVMSMSSPTIIMDDVPTFVGGGAKARKLARESFGRRRFLQQDIMSDMSMPETSMSMVDAIPTMLPTMMLEVGDADPGFNIQSIHCTWQPGFADFLEKPLRACRKMDDGIHIVPYLCDGVYENICCSVSELTNPTMQIFGTCNKADVVMNDDDEGETPESDPSPSQSPIGISPESESESASGAGVVLIQCTWKSSFEGVNHTEACTDDKYSVPYACDEGKNVCCTASNIASLFYSNYGNCYKL